jgi:DNA-binding winged helix-turn-helix (wHTH) protein
VHVRRLRAKLGPEHEALIGTVRNVGYRFVPVKAERAELAREERARTAAAGPGTVRGPGARTAASTR